MPNKKSKTSKKTNEFIPVLFADSMEEAECICQLLEDHGIKAFTDPEQCDTPPTSAPQPDGELDTVKNDDDVAHGLPVYVSKADSDEANEIISERDDDIDEFALDDEDFDGDDDDEDFGMGPDTGDDDLFDYDEENLEDLL